ncbi:hypothetical protein BLOT_014002 [Blomia tropicalis]|nr:hypothetical protein BLOT_014002 [Blomia tropicalis]
MNEMHQLAEYCVVSYCPSLSCESFFREVIELAVSHPFGRLQTTAIIHLTQSMNESHFVIICLNLLKTNKQHGMR